MAQHTTKQHSPKEIKEKTPSIFRILKKYKKMVIGLVFLAIAANALTLVLPKLIARVIDTYINGTLDITILIIEFSALSLGILIFTFLQTIVQTYASERVARDLRSRLMHKISKQAYRFIEERNPSQLLTNITSDIDSIKMFVAQAIASLAASFVIIVGVATILLLTDWKLGLAVLTIIPLIGVTFFFILRLVRKLFKRSREVIDWLNKIINESIIGAPLIRVLHSESTEFTKFEAANTEAREIGIGILNLFSFMIPIITFIASSGTLIVVVLGGYFVIGGDMTLGSLTAFMSYISILIFPILVIGFISNIVAQAGASYARIHVILDAADEKDEGTKEATLKGNIELKDVTVMYGEKPALKSVSLSIAPHSKTAILGPTAAGKTQLFNVVTGLITPQSGDILYDGIPLCEYNRDSLYPQIGLVFQDSVLFNTTLRENIAFSDTVTDDALTKAIETAELSDFISTLPNGLDTIVSERGASLSGGQKQRIMLARALALNPEILYLDEFTARVDANTEAKVLANIEKNYPGLTLVSITQRIAPVENYEQIILLMEGEILARGTHENLMKTSPEYIQIYESQRSTNTYELRT